MRTSSLEAKANFEASGKKETHYKEITSVLFNIGACACITISKNCSLDYHQVQRRMRNGR